MTILRLALLTGLLVLALGSSASARTLIDPCEEFGNAGGVHFRQPFQAGVVNYPGGSLVCSPKLSIAGTQRRFPQFSSNSVIAATQCPPGQYLDHPLMADGVYDNRELIGLNFAKTHIQWDYWSAWAGWIYWDVWGDSETSFSLGAGGPDGARIPIMNAWTETGTNVTRLILHCLRPAHGLSGVPGLPPGFDVAADESPGPDDLVHGDPGDDELRGGTGDDHVHGGAGDDELRGDAGRDVLQPGPGDDDIAADAGRDMVIDDGGRDTIALGPGHDTANIRDDARDRISCGAGEDAVVVDPIDRVDDDCEHAYPGATPAVPPVLGR